jgi:hypothetical protein
MKLSDFKNIEDLRAMQQAIKDTRAKYDGYRDHQIPKWNNRACALCFVCDKINSYEPCSCCLWEIVEGYSNGNFLYNPCQLAEFYKQKTFTRRNRLDRWYNLIEEEIRRRG